VRHDRIPAFRRQVIYVHQRPALPEETVQASLERPFSLGEHRDRKFDRRWAVERLARLGRDESFLSKTPGDLSGGESQIVALLRALQLDPIVLLLDEPTAALDRHTTESVEQLLDQWVGDPAKTRALVWVSHDAGQAQRVASKTLRMEAGHIVEES
jgi:putative ABC transport system ATP-binding protein